MKKYRIFDDNLVLFNNILNDIKNAKQSIWIEIYRFGKDAMGERFRMALETKVKEVIEVKFLVDACVTVSDISFFEPAVASHREFATALFVADIGVDIERKVQSLVETWIVEVARDERPEPILIAECTFAPLEFANCRLIAVAGLQNSGDFTQ